LYLNYSQGFLPPQISELYRGVKIPALKPALYNNIELGGWFQLQKNLSVEFGIYQLDGKNEIITVRLEDGSRENKNAGKTQHRGIEYGINYTPISDLTLRVSGTNATHQFIDYIENNNDYSGNEMGQAPKWIANTELSYKPAAVPGLRAAIEWQHVNKYFMDNANSTTYKGFDLFNLRLGYTFKNFEIWTNTMNLSNQLYATVARRTQYGDSYNIGERRTIYVGIGYNFSKSKNN